ncbi:hypothetical protein ACFMKJ_17545 [Acinetobacter baumannii]
MKQGILYRVDHAVQTNLDQLKENIQAFEIELSPEILQGIEAIHIQQPNPAP